MPSTPAADLRQSLRIPAKIPIKLAAESEDFKLEHQASTVDVSLRGAKIRAPLALVPGEMVGVIPRRGSPRVISARVVWSQRAEKDEWSLAGLEFLETLPP